MAQTIQNLQIKISVDFDKKQINVVDTSLGELEQKLSQSSKTSNIFQSDFKTLVSAFGLGSIAAQGVIGVFNNLIGIMKQGVRQAIESAQAQKEFEFTMRTLGDSFASNIPVMNEWVNRLSEATVFTQTETLKAFQTLMKYTGDLSTAQKLLVISTKLATETNTSLVDVAHKLGYATKVPELGVRALRAEYGELIGTSKNVQDALNNLDKNLSTHSIKTDDVVYQIRLFRKNWDETVENAGKLWLPILNDLLKTINSMSGTLGGMIERLSALNQQNKNLSDYVKKNPELMKKFSDVFLNEIDKMNTGQVKTTQKTLDQISKEVEKTQISIKKTAKEIEEEQKRLEKERKEREKEEARRTNEQWDAIERAQKESLDRIRADWEKTAGTIYSSMQSAFSEVIASGNFTADGLGQVFNRIRDAFIKMLADMFAEFLAKKAMMAILNLIPGGGLIGTALGLTGQTGGGLGKLVGLQEGGIVTKPTVAMLGERGAEAVIPLEKTSQLQPQINININALDVRTISRTHINRIARQLTPLLKRELQR